MAATGRWSVPPRWSEGGPLSGKVGAGLDPCAALQTSIELRPGASAEIVFFLGQAESKEQARELLGRYRTANLNAILSEVTGQWDNLLNTVQITTPDPAMDILMNRWLLYQTLASRIWARAAFYQLSGAYGFRDQLQDGMALCVAKPRDHARASAARGLAPIYRRRRSTLVASALGTWCANADLRRPALAALCRHQFHRNDRRDGRAWTKSCPSSRETRWPRARTNPIFEPRVSETRATLFEHCARALDRSLAVGSHGLPLMGTGDWNDGMNRVGEHGKGESVWLGWFLHTILWEFAKVADSRGEHERAESWRLHVSALKAALERDGWDGEWYRRAYFDDGTPLGSAENTECRIDSIAQSWGVMSGAAEPGRASRAMGAVDRQLVRRPEGLVLLFTPPFDRTPT